ncbi:MAG TPA: MBL fold metallo-hydrolase [Niallia sp.]|nr:MBL fold metallo-hydrolase [Niallia sp.]
MKKQYICKTCGTQYDEAESFPSECKICTDERQYVPDSGQEWTTMEQLVRSGYQNKIIEKEQNLYSIKTYPQVGIGQNAYLLITEKGNFLWDCITYIDDETQKMIQTFGGIDGIILSHPHYYSTIVEWAEAFNCPIYIHTLDRKWITRKSNRYIFWEGESLQLAPGVTVINLGGHFDGSSVLHWKKTNGDFVLLVGDTLFIVPDKGWLSFMYSHPNRIPLPAFAVERIKQILEDYEFTRIFGAFDNNILEQGKEAVMKSAERYIYHVNRTER